jgi:hypothetical protein
MPCTCPHRLEHAVIAVTLVAFAILLHTGPFLGGGGNNLLANLNLPTTSLLAAINLALSGIAAGNLALFSYACNIKSKLLLAQAMFLAFLLGS